HHLRLPPEAAKRGAPLSMLGLSRGPRGLCRHPGSSGDPHLHLSENGGDRGRRVHWPGSSGLLLDPAEGPARKAGRAGRGSASEQFNRWSGAAGFGFWVAEFGYDMIAACEDDFFTEAGSMRFASSINSVERSTSLTQLAGSASIPQRAPTRAPAKVARLSLSPGV